MAAEGEGPFPQGGQGAPLTVILRPLLVEDGVCRQFEVPPLVAVVVPAAVEGGVGEVGCVLGTRRVRGSCGLAVASRGWRRRGCSL